MLVLSHRQSAVPLHSWFWRWLLHNNRGFSCGRRQNTVHELRLRPVQQRRQLRSHNAEKGRTHSFLQGVNTTLHYNAKKNYGKTPSGHFFTSFSFTSFRFVPSFLRLGSWNIVMFVSYEQIKRGMTRAQQYWESPFWTQLIGLFYVKTAETQLNKPAIWCRVERCITISRLEKTTLVEAQPHEKKKKSIEYGERPCWRNSKTSWVLCSQPIRTHY